MQSIVKHLIKIVDMYLDIEENHYKEALCTAKMHNKDETDLKDHIFHSLLELSIWIKTHHTMPDIDENVSAEIQTLKEIENERGVKWLK